MPDLNVWPGCNSDCVMCTNPPRLRRTERSAFAFPALVGKLEGRLPRLALQGIKNGGRGDYVLLTGGEPTLHPHLRHLLRWLHGRSPGARIELLTNGRLLAGEEFTRRLLAASPRLRLVVPVHSLSAAAHDAVTRVPGSFKETLQGIGNVLRLRGPGHSLEVRVVVQRMNYRAAPRTVEGLLRRFPLDRLVVVFAEYEGAALRSLPQIGLRYREFRPALERFRARCGDSSRLAFYHFPRCVAPRGLWPRIPRSQPSGEIGFAPSCGRCYQRPACSGIHRGYLELFGPEEFRPIP